MPDRVDEAKLLKDLVQIGIALTSERDLSALLERIVTESRAFTGAEAGTLFLRVGSDLRFGVVQNDVLGEPLGDRELRRRLQAAVLPVSESSLAGWVARTGQVLNLADAYAIPPGSPYHFNPAFDRMNEYRTRSVLIVPLQEPSGQIIGVLELINARRPDGQVAEFAADLEDLVRSLASLAAVAIRNAKLEDLSFVDGLTGIYNRRYFQHRLQEEVGRHARFGEPVGVVLLDLDFFKEINDELGHPTGDDALREVAGLLGQHSRSFTVVTRWGGDEFAILLVNTPKAGAVAYAYRIKGVIERHAFPSRPITVSLGVSGLPEDGASAEDLVAAADRALYEAKRLGRNRVGVANQPTG